MQTSLPPRLARLCTLLGHGCTLACALLIAGYGVVLVDPEPFLPPVETATGLTPGKRVALATLAAVILAPAGVALWTARGLFGRYGQGCVFSHCNAAAIRRIGAALLLGTGLAIAGRTAAVLILTHDNPPGARTLAVSFAGHDVLLGLLGALLMVMGWVLAEATRQADENRLFV
ncbi:hypothetical protein Dshi_2717 [Dinoroseobacter shibae DFL 12 = DSM 16493]|uniref:DUF2975 domain-containing protein n=1 Tax=Dinoroseobacter shibae (strain DSM 16493 / NCIMB 14021 / DFL 12) TaxID=398580 RepID=A8LIK9_DINSH|nr:DUF2975 domain-containing protein [Dinoroseobacter shibae]ABV94450.1 hypothetical protein Dshi_2717 [Dinoroseobacter shibae DFL 12 = DSM 16493]URF45877.1 DUF2975 domain-containing protein [Dinoroseobacter shibae]URF50184.1 DUF2975 domain-containing protein [Dinoroseobacter shibae]